MTSKTLGKCILWKVFSRFSQNAVDLSRCHYAVVLPYNACTMKRIIAKCFQLSVCLSVRVSICPSLCSVNVLWTHYLDQVERSFLCSVFNVSDLVLGEHPQISVRIQVGYC